MRPRRLLFLSLVLGGLLAAFGSGIVLAQGSDLDGKLLTGSDITIPTGTVDHDVYAFGGRVTSNATINGELVAAGGTILVDGSVQGDVIATGGQITINGSVGGHVRAAGGQVTVAGSVAKDVLAAGGQVAIDRGGSVGGDLIVSAGQLRLDGTVAGSATGGVGTYDKAGTVSGTDAITISQAPQGPTLAASNPVLDAIRHFIAVVLIGLLLLWLWPRLFRAAEAAVRDRPLPSFGWGIVASIGYFVVVILIFVVATIVGLVLAALGFGALLGIDIFAAFVSTSALTLAFIVVVAFVADAIVALALARAVVSRSGGDTSLTRDAAALDRTARWSDLLPFIVGVAVVVVLTSLPIVGGLIKLVVVLLGLGAILLVLRHRSGPVATQPVIATS
ncbi:MAG TPA: hypothetical protein VFI28_01795 [Candidatus Limnocylindrales bacterium]|nr:hypothetical protein [Candidatus Limnocylindrales bacterium]